MEANPLRSHAIVRHPCVLHDYWYIFLRTVLAQMLLFSWFVTDALLSV
jgi:hypothetical protein